LTGFLGESEALAEFFDDAFGLLFLEKDGNVTAENLRRAWAYLFNEGEDVTHCALESIFVNGVCAHG
jgi:hypothetical protein